MKPLSFRQEFETAGQFYIMALLYWISVGIMAAFWVLYFLSLGLEYIQVSFLLMLYPIASFLSEIPTGVVADTFGRKKSVFFSYLLTGLSFAGILLSGSNIVLLSIFQFLAGISFTFETGALESWIVDTAKYKKKGKYLEKIFGRRGSMAGIGFVIGPLLGGILVNYGYGAAFWATSIGFLVLAFFVLFFTKEIYFKKKKLNLMKNIEDGFENGKKGIGFVFKNKNIFAITIIAFILVFVSALAYNSYQPYVVSVGLKPQFIGYALSLSGLVAIVSLNYAHKISDFLGGQKRTLILFTFLYGLMILFIGMITYIPFLFLCLAGSIVFIDLSGIESPTFKHLYNKFVPSKIRATVISTSSFFWGIAQLLGLIGFGFFSQYFGLQYGIILAGIFGVLAAFLYLLIKKF